MNAEIDITAEPVFLVVDDDPGVSDVIEPFLLSEYPSSAVRHSGSVEEALTYMKEHSVNCVLVRLRRDETTGSEFLLRAANGRACPTPMVILVDLECPVSERAQLLTSGENAVLSWPCDPTEVLAIIGVILRLSRAEAAVRAADSRLKIALSNRAQAQIEAQIKFKDLFTSVGNAVSVYQACDGGSDFLLVEMNPAAERIERLRASEALGRRILDLFPGAQAFGLCDAMERVWRTGKAERLPLAHYQDDRISGWRDTYLYKLPTGEVAAVYEDVTERVRTEEQLRLTQFSVDRAADAVFWVNPSGRLVYVNDSACRSLGYERGDLLRLSVPDIDPDLPGEVWPGHFVEVKERGSFQFESRFKASDGRVFPVEIMTNYLEFGGEEYAVAFARDISERKRAEEEEERRRRQLAQVDRLVSLGTLVSGVAHEINNPNQFIMINAEILERIWGGLVPVIQSYRRDHGDFSVAGLDCDGLKEEMPKLLSGLFEGSERIRRIVQELREFAQARPPDQLEPVDINAVLKSAVVLLGSLLRRSTNRFTVLYGDGLPLLMGNFQRIEQVLLNLIQNACQALPDADKGIRVSTGCDGNAIIVEVEDEGIGIDAANLPYIADPFFTTRRESGGTGLGLSISSMIVNEHGGTLRFRSVKGSGTTATVVLPLGRTPDGPAQS